MISIIIPTLNQQEEIAQVVSRLLKSSDAFLIREVIVADGGSSDNTVDEAAAAGAKVLTTPSASIGLQLQSGALMASSPIMYFMNAGSPPPAGFAKDIIDTVSKGHQVGAHRHFPWNKSWFLMTGMLFSKFDLTAFKQGNQGFFVSREIYERSGGFKMKGNDFVYLDTSKRLQRLRRPELRIPLPETSRVNGNGVQQRQPVRS